MKDETCAYCMKGELVDKFAYPCCELEHSSVYVFREQSHLGRCIVASNQHVGDLVELTEEERNGFFADVAKVSKAIHKAYHPDKVNYGAYHDLGSHLHFHLVPKYKDGVEWGTTFEMNNGKVLLTEEEYEEIAKKIRANM